LHTCELRAIFSLLLDCTMDIILVVFSVLALIFGVYWYFIHVPDYYGYITKRGEDLKKYLSPDELLLLSKQDHEDIWILDVREEENFLLGHIPGAKNLPHDKVDQWYSEIPKNKKLILYCDLSLKTQNVIVFLEEKGYDQMLNWGKYKRWKFDEVVEETITI